MYGTHEHPHHGGHEGHGDRRGAWRFGGPRWGHGRRGPFGPGGPGGPGGFGGFGPEGFGPGRGRRGRRGPGRRSRGDVRLAVLALLAEAPMHGYQIIQEITERSGGAWAPSPGSVYPTVSQLADEGLVRTEKTEGRSVVHLTDEGSAWVEAHRAEIDGIWSTAAAEDGFEALRTAGRELIGAARQVASVGSEQQVAEAVRLIDDTRRRLYLLLAGETPDSGERTTETGEQES